MACSSPCAALDGAAVGFPLELLHGLHRGRLVVGIWEGWLVGVNGSFGRLIIGRRFKEIAVEAYRFSLSPDVRAARRLNGHGGAENQELAPKTELRESSVTSVTGSHGSGLICWVGWCLHTIRRGHPDECVGVQRLRIQDVACGLTLSTIRRMVHELLHEPVALLWPGYWIANVRALAWMRIKFGRQPSAPLLLGTSLLCWLGDSESSEH
ncbi:hypothetical protein L1887_61771 [Cichorium endivia]|nr:hypothetical protein L1887_61771 [Cichorium endivia]